MITGGQLRAARSLLGWNQDALAENSGVAVSTVRRMEAGLGPVRGYSENVWSVQRALEEAGIQFIDQDDGGGVGVRFREGN